MAKKPPREDPRDRPRRPSSGARGAFLVVAAVACVLTSAEVALSNRAGAPDGTGSTGCGPSGACHGGGEASSVIIRMDGLPPRYEPGRTYPLTFSVGPDSMARRNSAGEWVAPGGFAVNPEGGGSGYVEALAGDKASRTSHDTVTQTDAGTFYLAWRFNWTAPNGRTPAVLAATGMMSEGDLLGQDTDWWKTDVWRVQARAAESPGALAAAAIAAIAIALAAFRRRPPRPFHSAAGQRP